MPRPGMATAANVTEDWKTIHEEHTQMYIQGGPKKTDLFERW